MLTKHSMPAYNERIIKNPNLPESEVKLVAISESAGEAIAFLHSQGVRTVDIKENSSLLDMVSSHADIRILPMPNGFLYCYENEFEIYNNLQFFTVKAIREKMSKTYPDDVRLNCAIISDKIICNKKTVSREILEFAEMSNMKIIDVKQGYAKCSICILNENAIITDDASIYKSAQNFFNDILLVSKGSIGLNRAEYGFIGGCTGKLSKNLIAFNGRIDSHINHNEITDLLSKYNLSAIELTDNRLEDIGGIIPLTEAIR